MGSAKEEECRSLCPPCLGSGCKTVLYYIGSGVATRGKPCDLCGGKGVVTQAIRDRWMREH